MSVLVKGMEKPEHCGYCRFRYGGICHALQKTQYSMDECPLAGIDDVPDICVGDTISRQAAIKAICEDGTWLESQGCTEITMAERKQRDADILCELPSAQPEIIRCKDCKHRPTGTGANHDLEFPDYVCPCQCDDYYYSWMPKDDWFCKDGERKEE